MLDTAPVPVAVMLASTGSAHADRPHADRGTRAVRVARTFLHTPYVWAGESRGGVDCSGLVVAVYRRLGVRLPHQSDVLWRTLPRVRHPRKGDIVAFGWSGSSDHVGIYIGGGRFIHAVGAGRGVRIGHLFGRAAHRGYLGAVRPRLHRRKARQAVQHAAAVVRGGEWVHHRDAQGWLVV